MKEFDKSKIYTAVNAEELKIGSKVVVADNLDDLKLNFSKNNIAVITDINHSDKEYRFSVENSVGYANYALAYLIEESKERFVYYIDVSSYSKGIKSLIIDRIQDMYTGYTWVYKCKVVTDSTVIIINEVCNSVTFDATNAIWGPSDWLYKKLSIDDILSGNYTSM